MPYKDPLDPRAREARRKWYYANKQRQLDRQRARKRKLADWIQEIKAKTPCTDCGQRFHFSAMDFDHLPEFEKTKAVNQLLGYGKAAVEAEMAKCELVCANCHRIRTFNRSIV